jgi:hypothetical protein
MSYRPYVWMGEEQDAHVNAWKRHVAIMQGFREVLEVERDIAKRPRFEIVSKPGAVIDVERVNLRLKERRNLTIYNNIFHGSMSTGPK